MHCPCYTHLLSDQLEYASDVWGGCSSDCDRLEKLPLIVARIVTVLLRFASRESLFRNGMEHIKHKRKISRLKTMYKNDNSFTRLQIHRLTISKNVFLNLDYSYIKVLLFQLSQTNATLFLLKNKLTVNIAHSNCDTTAH